ncbi:MAG: hypothetical protein QXT76_03815 [Sulfolobales archaeon]
MALPETPKMWVLGVALNAPKPDENPSGMRGNRDEAMKTCIRAEPLKNLTSYFIFSRSPNPICATQRINQVT